MAKTTKTSSSRKKTASRTVAAPTEKPKQSVTRVKVDETKRSAPKLRFNRRSLAGNGARLNPSRLLAELVGTFVLTLVIVAALSGKFTLSFFATPEIISQAVQNGQSIPSFGIMPFVGGLALAVLVMMTYRISNGFFNPAVVVGQMVLRRTQVVEGVGYIIAQILGAMLALTVATRLITVFNAEAGELVALNPATLFNRTSDWTVFFAELLGAFVFGLGVAAAMRYAGAVRGAIVGAAFVIAVGVAATAGAGLLNPALAIGVGMIGFGDGDTWALAGIYLGGSTLGVLVGMGLYTLIARGEESTAPVVQKTTETV